MGTPIKKIYANPEHHDLQRAFVLIKPSRPHYVQGEDYHVLEPFTEKIVGRAKLVIKETKEIKDIPEVYAYLCRDLNLPKLQQTLRNYHTETNYDILVFSSNAFYHDFYHDKKLEATEYRNEIATQYSLL